MVARLIARPIAATIAPCKHAITDVDSKRLRMRRLLHYVINSVHSLDDLKGASTTKLPLTGPPLLPARREYPDLVPNLKSYRGGLGIIVALSSFSGPAQVDPHLLVSIGHHVDHMCRIVITGQRFNRGVT